MLNDGRYAFNGASTANLSIRSIYIVCNTNLAACGGGMAWTILEYIHTKKFSIIGFCSGIIRYVSARSLRYRVLTGRFLKVVL
jgi:ammonia channel protein AmtB